MTEKERDTLLLKIATKIDSIDEKVNKLGERMTALEERVTALEEEMTALEEEMTALKEKVTKLATEFNTLCALLFLVFSKQSKSLSLKSSRSLYSSFKFIARVISSNVSYDLLL